MENICVITGAPCFGMHKVVQFLDERGVSLINLQGASGKRTEKEEDIVLRYTAEDKTNIVLTREDIRHRMLVLTTKQTELLMQSVKARSRSGADNRLNRLLVRGERTEYTEDKEEEAGTEVKKTQSKWMEEYTKSIIISSSVLAVMLIVLLIWRHFAGRRRRKRRKKKQTRNNQKRRKKKSSANTNGKRESPDRQKSEARAGKKKRKPREEPD